MWAVQRRFERDLPAFISRTAELGFEAIEINQDGYLDTPDVDVMRVLCFGHRSTMTDAIWLRALPDFSRPFEDKELKERWLNGVFDVCAELDPTFGLLLKGAAPRLEHLDERRARRCERRDPDRRGPRGGRL